MAGLDQFEFIRQIGKGSYGEVTLQRHKKDRKQVRRFYKHMTTRKWYSLHMFNSFSMFSLIFIRKGKFKRGCTIYIDHLLKFTNHV